uniref:G_PROTEIN_RECEP_F1_2 domain-containing protein n=1 Tax=Bursaphelenchus xylophilus TaxID=6326 RepID=A0A1I7S2E7_BURXY
MGDLISTCVARLREFQLSWEPKEYDKIDLALFILEMMAIGYGMFTYLMLMILVLRTRLINVLTKTVIVNKWISFNGYLTSRLFIIMFPTLGLPDVIRMILLLVLFITFQSYYTSVIYVAVITRLCVSFPFLFRGIRLIIATVLVILGVWLSAILFVGCITLYPQFGMDISVFHFSAIITSLAICHKILNQSSLEYRINAVGDLKRKHEASVNIRSVRILSIVSVVTTFYTTFSLSLIYGMIFFDVKSEFASVKLPRINNIIFDVVEGSLAAYLVLKEPALRHNSRIFRHFTSVKNVLGVQIYTENNANDHFNQLQKQWMNWT